MPDWPGPTPAWTPLPLSLSNLDHRIDDGLADALQAAPQVYAAHYAWDHHGLVWWDGGEFHERVAQHRVPVAVVSAPTLQRLMAAVNDLYGWD